MYYVIAIARDYNIAISNRAGAPGGSAAFFNARLENCTGPFQTIDCNITIDFDWDAGGAGSGTGQVTIFSGSSGNSTIPAPGNPLTSIAITNISSDCTNYNSIQGCPAFSNVTTTTTTTTTTSTTTTTTTVAPVSYPAPIIKYDQYSSSFGPGGNPIWPNVGSGGSTYDMGVGGDSSITALGTGTGIFLRLKGGVRLAGPAGEVVTFINPALTGDFVSLYNKSFSYAIVFRFQNPTISGFNYISNIYAFNERYVPAEFYMYNNLQDNNPTRPRINSGIAQYDADRSEALAGISTVSEWYLGVSTFDKDGTTSNCLKFYLNNIKIDASTLSSSPSSFFNSVQNLQAKHSLSWGINEVDVAAVIFWDNVILSQGQVQSLYNEYNARYTLG
jgi:hypothetical protein